MSNKKKTIIFISNESKLFGAPKVLLNIIKYFHLTRKYNLLVVCPNEGPFKTTLDQMGIPTNIHDCLRNYYFHVSHPSIFLIQHLRRIYDNLKLFFYFIRLFQNVPNPVIYANTSVVRYIALPALIIKVKLLWHVHEYFENPIKQKFHSMLINICSDKIIVNSQILIPKFKLSHKSQSKIFQFRFLEILEKPSNLEIYNSRPVYDILFAGRISVEKGVLDLLSAINHIVKNSKNLKVLIIGSFVPKDKNKILEFFINNKLEKYVTFHDFDPEINKYILNSKVVVLPSYRESLGLIILEALMLEKPVIGTDVGDIPSMISHNKNGLVIKPGNIQQLTDAIIQILDEKKYNKFIAGAKKRKQSILSAANNYRKLEEIVDRI